MKSVFLFLLPLFVTLSCLSQVNFDAQNDSLQQQLATATHDSIRAKALSALSGLWQGKNLPKAIGYAKQGVKYAENLTDKGLWMGLLYQLAFGYMAVGDAPRSIEILQQLLTLTEHDYPGGYATALGFISMNYKVQGDYANALKYARKGFVMENELFRTHKLNDIRAYFGSPMNLAEIFAHVSFMVIL